ncbi:uncharacterized protein METZ01_LOCUS243981 [marine metagenome]|uniref:Uncharacterized protein n=1 Tax=marine metagenome TaxID=408172 RepID=A0A382HW26_9ZZZZ
MEDKDLEFDEDIRKKYDLRTVVGKKHAREEQLSRIKKREEEQARRKKKEKFIAWAKANNHNPSYPPVGKVLLEFKDESRRPRKYMFLHIFIGAPVAFLFLTLGGLLIVSVKFFFPFESTLPILLNVGFSIYFTLRFTRYLTRKSYEKLNLKEFFILKILFPIILIAFLCLWNWGYLNKIGLPQPKRQLEVFPIYP